jgi:hypothetical protein
MGFWDWEWKYGGEKKRNGKVMEEDNGGTG